MESNENMFYASKVVERSSVRLLVKIGLKGIGQLDLPPWFCQGAGNPASERKKARQSDKGTRCVLETAKGRELLHGIGDKHVFPEHILASCETKKVDQDEGIPDDGTMNTIGLNGPFPFQVVHNGFYQHPDVLIGHLLVPQAPGG
jgi:hypothetical protein